MQLFENGRATAADDGEERPGQQWSRIYTIELCAAVAGAFGRVREEEGRYGVRGRESDGGVEVGGAAQHRG